MGVAAGAYHSFARGDNDVSDLLGSEPSCVATLEPLLLQDAHFPPLLDTTMLTSSLSVVSRDCPALRVFPKPPKVAAKNGGRKAKSSGAAEAQRK
ncbi:hypothetical protein ACFX1X_029757 [Malus domestica]